MIEFFIDEQRVDLPAGCSVKLSASLDELTAPTGVKERVWPLTLPATARNRVVLGFSEQTFSPERFNHAAHTGRVTCHGALLLHGRVELTACETDAAGATSYQIALRVPPPAWIERAGRTPLRETALPYRKTLNEWTIQESWSEEEPVKFLPVKRDAEPAYGQERTVLGSLYYENYHPFVQIRALMEAIAEAAGYRIESQFMDEPFFRSLYMSGRYAATAPAEEVSRMDFAARRAAADQSATADNKGVVHTAGNANSVGAPVDELVAAETTQNPYYGQSLRTLDGRLAFVPEADVITGFEWQMTVKHTPQLFSATQLQALGRIDWGGETIREAEFRPNPLTDLKNSGGDAGQYRVVCFGPSGIDRRVTVHFTGGTAGTFNLSQLSVPVSCPYPFTRAVCEEDRGGVYVPVEHWALYNNAEYQAFTSGLKAEEISLTLHAAPRLRRKNEPVFFDTLVFETVPGATLILCRGARVRPLFYAMPEAGAAVAFASIFAHQATQLELIEAMAHLFGLHFYTDDAARTIRVEPRFTFLNGTHEIDWTDKIDAEQPLVWEDAGGDGYEVETLGYRSGDAAVERADTGTGQTFGHWSAGTAHRFARAGERVNRNPLFTATRNERDSLRSAPDASMIVVGNRNAKKESMDFPEKIVRYLGLLPLPEGQRWGWPGYGAEYPAVGFSPGLDGFTLCFDDEAGQLGLKNYHLPGLELTEKGRKLTLYLRLAPSDIEAVRYPNSACRDFRGNFVFRLRGEKIHGRLVEIRGYDPAKSATRCTFTVESKEVV